LLSEWIARGKALSFTNLLLSTLSPECLADLLVDCVAVGLPVKTYLYHSNDLPRYVYFLTSGIASVVTRMRDGAMVEVELIGVGGIVGGLHLLGPAQTDSECFMQLDGTGLRMEFSKFKRVFLDSVEVRDAVLAFVQVQAFTLSQMCACNRLHSAEARLARWLLMASDRTERDTLNLTQEFLAIMLGASRTTVTQVAHGLQRKQLIEYRRGQIQITNRAGLEGAACFCYHSIKELFYNLYQPIWTTIPLRVPVESLLDANPTVYPV
jgi:CRP-like cAMP-binding protein